MGVGFKTKFMAFLMLLSMLFIPTMAFAETKSTIEFSYVAENVEFDLYKVAEINSDGSFGLIKEFEKYSVSLNDTSAAQTLASYIQRDKLTPLLTAKTDNACKAVFGGLDKGIYLISGEVYENDTVRYTALPVLTSIANNGENIAIKGKYESENKNDGGDSDDGSDNDASDDDGSDNDSSGGGSSGGGGGSSTSINLNELSVVKVWKGNSPKEEITAQLLKDGNVYDEVVLNNDNNWRHTWKNLGRNNVWSVVEKEVPQGYKVSIEKDGQVYIITNSSADEDYPGEKSDDNDIPDGYDSSDNTDKDFPYSSDDEYGNDGTDITDDNETSADVENPSDSDENGYGYGSGNGEGYLDGSQGSGVGTASGSSDNSYSGSSATAEKDEKLPQTGQLWWPVAILSCLGVLFLIIGIGFKREGR